MPPAVPALLAALGLLAGAAPAAEAQALYVVEQLVVSVSSTPDAGGERIASLKSGDRVELIERSGDAVHVRLANGKDGWLRSSYLSTEQPLRPRLQQSEAEVTSLKAQVSRLEAQLSGASSLRAAAPLAAAPEEAAPAAQAPLFSAAGEAAAPRVWPWAVLSAALALVVGFALGWWMLDRSIRKKYGGLKIY
ncbi:MAG TPA: SH3 domain-containing protein [Steroidobacteraceae bacterium]